MKRATRHITMRAGYRKITRTDGYSLMETIIVVAVLSVLIAYGVQAMRDGKSKTHFASRNASLRALCDASTRARLAETPPGPGLLGTDKEAAIEWYMQQQLLVKRPVYTEGLLVADGNWSIDANDLGPAE